MHNFLLNAVSFMSRIKMFLGDATTTAGDLEPEQWMTNIVEPIQDVVLSVLWPVLFVLSIVGIIYVVMLGVQYAKAETPDKRDAAKSRMVNAIVGIVIMLVLIIVMLLIGNNLKEIIEWVDRLGRPAASSA